MTVPDYLTTDDSEKEDEVSNLKPSEIKQKGSFIPFLRNGSPNRKSFEKLMERQSSHLSVTTATSTSTQSSLGDMLLAYQSGHITIIEGEEGETLSQNLNIKSSPPPKTPTTVAAEESFLSSDDDKDDSAKEVNFLDRLEGAIDDGMPDVSADHDSEDGQDDVMFQHQVNFTSTITSENCSVSDLQSPSPSSSGDFRDTLKIDAVLHRKQEDEETRLAVAPLVVAELKAPPSEDSTASKYADIAIENTTENGSDSPVGSDESDPEQGVPQKKMFVDGKSIISSRIKSLKMIFVACVFATVVGITIPFFLETSARSRAAIATASPSVSMAPSSTPSLSQAPSKAPSSNPSLHPTISSAPTIPPSGHPTVSLGPSMVPSISAVPSVEPSIAPTESMVPSENPSEAPSASPSSTPSASPSIHPTVSMSPSDTPSSIPTPSPSARPTQNPTITFEPSRQPSRHPTPSPTRPPTPRPTRRPTPPPTGRPSESPTDAPSRPPITLPPPANLGDAFKIRLFWNETYFWQEEKAERFWCMECVKCKEYGGLDAPDHGCNSYGTGDESRCRAGDSLWIRDCRGRGNRFNIQGSQGEGFMIRIATTDLCIEKIEHDHPHLYIQKCDLGSPFQRFMPWNDNHKFEIRSRIARNDCVSQAHHPKSGELIALHNCVLADQDETLFWEQY